MDNKWLISSIVILGAMLTGCRGDQNNTDTKTQKTEAAPKKSGGPGDADDRPVTMGSGSLDFTWDDVGGISRVDANTRAYAYSDASNSHVNQVKFQLSNAGVALGQAVFRRNKAQPMTIMIACGNGANPQDEVKIATMAEENANGLAVSPPHLQIVNVNGGANALDNYKKFGNFVLKHPNKKIKVRTIKISGVTMDMALTTGAHGCNLGAAPYVCTVNTNASTSDNDSLLFVSVCQPVNGSCPAFVQ